jgi:hypothetical protein
MELRRRRRHRISRNAEWKHAGIRSASLPSRPVPADPDPPEAEAVRQGCPSAEAAGGYSGAAGRRAHVGAVNVAPSLVVSRVSADSGSAADAGD